MFGPTNLTPIQQSQQGFETATYRTGPVRQLSQAVIELCLRPLKIKQKLRTLVKAIHLLNQVNDFTGYHNQNATSDVVWSLARPWIP